MKTEMMRNVYLTLLVMFFTGSIFAQVSINSDGANPDNSTMLDVKSTTKGFLPPRMTYAQRNAITGAPAGLTIWCSNCTAFGEMQVYNGTAWTNMTGSPASPEFVIGMSFQGGIVAYILQPGDPGYVAGQTHGLIAAPIDQSGLVHWGCYGTAIPGADGTALGTGNQNTIDIMASCATAEIAARICGDLVLNGYNDWYLPSKDELNKLYLNRIAIGGFNPYYYWSSSEYNSTTAWAQFFPNSNQNYADKGYSYCVRAVRAF